MYAKLNNNELLYAPVNFTTTSGNIILNFNRNTKLMKENGFKQVIDIKPEYNKETHKLVTSGYTETTEQITVNYEVLELTVDDKSVKERLVKLENMDVDILATSWDIDFRVSEVEWFLQDNFTPKSGVKLINEFIGGSTMALSRFEQAKILILGDGVANYETFKRQLKRYLDKGELIQDEYSTLLSMIDAKDIVKNT